MYGRHLASAAARTSFVHETVGMIETSNQQIPPILRMIMSNARRPRSQKANEAGRFILGRLTLAQYLAALE